MKIEYRIYFDTNLYEYKRIKKVFDLEFGNLLEDEGNYLEQDIKIFSNIQSVLDYIN